MRFSKDGTQLQLTAVDGRRALVVLPNDPELVDILARNGVDISGAAGLCVCVCGKGLIGRKTHVRSAVGVARATASRGLQSEDFNPQHIAEAA